MTAAKPRAALTAHGVDFVDEDEAGGVLFALHEEVAHAGSAHAHEHFHEVGTGDGEEGHARLTSHSPGKECLAGSGRADEEHTLGDAAPETGKFPGIGKEIHDFGKFFLGFVHTRHVVERDLALLLIQHPRARAAKGHGPPRSTLHLAHEENPHADEQQHGEP